MNVDTAFHRAGETGMGERKQLLACQHAPRVEAKCQQHVEFRCGHRDMHIFGAAQLARYWIDAPAGKSQRLMAFATLRPIGRAPHQAPDSGNQFPRIERLCNVVVRAQFEPNDAIDIISERRQHNDRCLSRCTQSPADVEAVLPRQHGVEDDQVKGLSAHRTIHVRGGFGRHRVKAILGQHLDQHRCDFRVILDEKDADDRIRRSHVLLVSGHGNHVLSSFPALGPLCSILSHATAVLVISAGI
ncbi:hypothetical protein MESS4_750254 [Mesorhizobium sp. STM 4661]|nr:hypothetical protein MESS4_750254 [Mesorhizobium sp. STM 4661]